MTSTTDFWKNLYKRFVVENLKNLSSNECPPKHLLPDKIFNERKGMRSRVIQTLYYTHDEFRKRKIGIDIKSKEHDYRKKSIDQLLSMSLNCTKMIRSPKVRGLRRYSPNNSSFDFNAYKPDYYLYYFKKVQPLPMTTLKLPHSLRTIASLFDENRYVNTDGIEIDENPFENIHQSEDIYANDDENIYVLYIKTLSNRYKYDGDRQMMEFYLRDAEILNVANRKLSYLTINFQDKAKGTELHQKFEDILELKLMNWFEYKETILNDNNWTSIF